MDAAPSFWRPLGEMLVDRGLLTPEELDEVLALQKESGRKLGEIIVERGFISGPTLALTLAEQWGVELASDEGFGTGLRNEIQRRHEGERKRRPDLHAVKEPVKGHEIFAPETTDEEALAGVSAQLAEDDARIAQLEGRLLDRDNEITKLESDARERQARLGELIRAEASRLEERFSETQKDLLAAAADWRLKHEAQIVKLLADKLGRLEDGLKQGRSDTLGDEERGALERRVTELVTHELAEARKHLVELTTTRRAEDEARLRKLLGEKLDAVKQEPASQPLDLSAHEDRIAKIVTQKASRVEETLLRAAANADEKFERRIAALVTRELATTRREFSAKLEALELPSSTTPDLSGHEARLEGRLGQLLRQELAQARKEFNHKLAALPKPQVPTIDFSGHEARLEERMARLVRDELAATRKEFNEKLVALPIPEPPVIDLSEHEARLEKRLVRLVREELAATRKQLSEKLDARPVPEPPGIDLSEHEAHISAALEEHAARVQETLMKRAAKTDERITRQLAAVETAVESIERGRKGESLERLGAELRGAVRRLDRLEELVRTSTRELMERFEPPAAPQETDAEEEQVPAPAFSEHLLFAPGESGYSLLTVELPPPCIGAELALGDGERFVVTKVARSPFPRDERPCAYVQRVS